MSKSLTFALQALLARHEQYMVDAERDRLEMSAKIEQLEADKRELENKNSKTIKENRGLLDQVEELITAAAESDTQIKALEATLCSTRQDLRRLETLTSRTHDLEVQLAALEVEQEALQRSLSTTQEEERSAIQRWRQAERRLNDLQDQLERIEREARDERERHVEVLGRMERQRVVERELDTAAGRLKGAAVATTVIGKNSNSVVSHFVKDILQDNANLQLGIVELREMLMDSNDEVQKLREQLLVHQPVTESQAENEDDNSRSTLQAELASKEHPQVVSQSLHIHHHYHIPKNEEVRRPKKKRTSLNTSIFTPPKPQSPRTTFRGQETENAILSQTAVTVPQPTTPNRWSIQSSQVSEFAPSSAPSSPQSAYRHSGLFDRGFDVDSSRPTSPDSSIDPMSPQLPPQLRQFHRKRGSEISTRSFTTALNFQSHVIHEEEDVDVEELPGLQTPSMSPLDGETTTSNVSRDTDYLPHDPEDWTSDFHPSLRRSSSHESILSISGIDIHTLKSRPSQLTITGSSALFRPKSRIGSPTTVVSIDTVVTAHPTLSRGRNSSASYLQSVRGQSASRSISSSHSNEGIGVKLGGWFGQWKVGTPAKSSGNLKPPPESSAPLSQPKPVASTTAIDQAKLFMSRSSGINQPGPIPGFMFRTEKAPHQVEPKVIDRDALRDIFLEDESPG